MISWHCKGNGQVQSKHKGPVMQSFDGFIINLGKILN